MLSFFLELALIAAASASVIPVSDEPVRHVSFPLERRTIDRPLRKRDDDVGLINATTTTYLFQLQIGTPGQSVDVVLDTGSFELWVDPTCSAAPNSAQAQMCRNAGFYDYTKSSTVQTSDIQADLPYGIGEALIDYVQDSIVVPGTSTKVMTSVIFGVAAETTQLPFGIAGVGHGKGFNLEYDNLIDNMASQGVTNSKAFSVALGPQEASNAGVVVFGGVDTKKFIGKLHQYTNLPPQIESGQTGLWRYWIQMDSVGITKPGSSSTTYSGSSLPIVLDTGSTLSYLPSSIVSQLASDFSASRTTDGLYSVDCSMMSKAGSVDFTFGTLTIKVPYKEFIWQAQPGTCFVGATAQSSSGTALLGDSFLRSAYVVLDQTNQNIFLAQYANCGTNEQTLTSAAGAAGNFTGQCTSAGNRGVTFTGSAAIAVVAIVLQLFMMCS